MKILPIIRLILAIFNPSKPVHLSKLSIFSKTDDPGVRVSNFMYIKIVNKEPLKNIVDFAIGSTRQVDVDMEVYISLKTGAYYNTIRVDIKQLFEVIHTQQCITIKPL